MYNNLVSDYGHKKDVIGGSRNMIVSQRNPVKIKTSEGQDPNQISQVEESGTIFKSSDVR